MSSKLFISLSAVALLGLSTGVYADWIWYSKDYDVSKPSGRLPNGDCLELICDNGCVEDDEEDYLGGCCPTDGSCKVDGKDVDACCEAGYSCSDGQCEQMTCQIGMEVYPEGGKISECTKCHDSEEIIDLKMVSSRSMGDECTEMCGCGDDSLQCSDEGYCCPESAPTEGQSCNERCPCDGELSCVSGICQGTCIMNRNLGESCTDDCECMDGTGDNAGPKSVCENGVCTIRTDSPSPELNCVKLNSKKNQKGKNLGCCQEGLRYVNYQKADKNNYRKSGYTPNKKHRGCCPEGNVTSDGRCCAANKIYTENDQIKCCSTGVVQDGKCTYSFSYSCKKSGKDISCKCNGVKSRFAPPAGGCWDVYLQGTIKGSGDKPFHQYNIYPAKKHAYQKSDFGPIDVNGTFGSTYIGEVCDKEVFGVRAGSNSGSCEIDVSGYFVKK